ncbi:hypothetical protein [Rhizobium leguminosarum]|uniref:hypothetical protein n=1 Tax=Rhizobium leguminosarum TaxID=384 RepID=UPI001FEF08AB|nr:hypothetical protein [Rhizobium leguminosarum]
MRIPTGGMTASAGEQSELDDRTNRLQKDLSSEGYTVIRDLLTADQVESLRLIVTQYLKSELQSLQDRVLHAGSGRKLASDIEGSSKISSQRPGKEHAGEGLGHTGK